MSGRNPDHTGRAFGFIEELNRLASPQAIIDAMERSFARYGFENFILTGLPHPARRIESLVLLKKWPLGWLAVCLPHLPPIVRLRLLAFVHLVEDPAGMRASLEISPSGSMRLILNTAVAPPAAHRH